MDPFEFSRQTLDRSVRTPAKLAQAPLRGAQLATAEPGATPFDVVLETGPVSLRRYEPRVPPDERRDVPLVIAYPFINDPSILDFAADRSVVRGFLEDGFPVYVAAWNDPSPLDRSLGLGDYVDRFLDDCVASAREETGSDAVHLLGYSTSAPLAAGYAALYPNAVRTLVLQGAPLSFDPDDGAIDPDAGPDGIDMYRTLATEHDPGRVADAFDTVPAALLEAALALRKPVEYAVTNPLRLWDRLDDEEVVAEYGRKLEWAVGESNPDLPAATYREFVEELLVENRLMEGSWRLNGRDVDLSNVEMPVLLVVGRDDAFVPPRASLPFLEAIPGDETAVLEFPTTHVGTSVAPEAHADWWPRVRDWLSDREPDRGRESVTDA